MEAVEAGFRPFFSLELVFVIGVASVTTCQSKSRSLLLCSVPIMRCGAMRYILKHDSEIYLLFKTGDEKSDFHVNSRNLFRVIGFVGWHVVGRLG